jgi:hypothetical protein
LNGFIGKMQQYAGVIAGSMVVSAAKQFVTDIVAQADALSTSSQQLGMSAKQLQQWQYIAKKANVEGSSLELGFKTLAKQAYEASKGSKASKDAFDTLGVSWKDGKGNLKGTDALMNDVAIALGGLDNHTEAVALSTTLLGKAGYKMLPAFADGAEGLERFRKKLEELGGGMTDDLLRVAGEADDALDDLEIATTSLKSRFAVALLPTLNTVIGKVSSWMGTIAKATQGTGFWKTALVTLAAVSLGPLIKQLWLLGKAAMVPLLKFALLYLVIDELSVFFAGGDSLIGRGLDALFGKGTQNKTRLELIRLKDELASGKWEPAIARLGELVVAAFLAINDQLYQFCLDIVEIVNIWSDRSAAAVSEWLSNLGTEIGFAIADLYNDSLALGESIVDGIVDGIVAGGKAIGDALIGTLSLSGGGALGKAAEYLASHSPSERAYDLAATVPQGMVQAFAAHKGKVGSALNAMIAQPLQRSLAVSQVNHNQITVQGGPTTIATGHAVGRSIGQYTRQGFDDASAALVPLA